MSTAKKFDVLVVYTEKIALSASLNTKINIHPFSSSTNRERYSLAYAYFLKKCDKAGLTAAFTTTKDIIGPGTCSSYWEYKKRTWKKVVEECFAPLIFDKFSPKSKAMAIKRDLLFSDGVSLPFNDTELQILFNDKLKTYDRLLELTIPTVGITLKTIDYALKRLNILLLKNENRRDFLDSYILKDRYGSGGIHIYKIGQKVHEEIKKILKENPSISFVPQPFALFNDGHQHEEHKGYMDIRIIYSHEKIVQRYIRTAGTDDFRCNEHQGGKVVYIKSNEVPKSVQIASREVLKTLDKCNAFFALDFIVSNNGNAYFLEGNIKPGIYWGNSMEDKINTKKLIVMITQEIKLKTLELNKTTDNKILTDIIQIKVPVYPTPIGL